MTQGVALAFGGRLNVDAWTRAHRHGAVPDLLPYGLHRLADHGFDVTHPHTSWSAGSPDAVVRRALRKLGGGYDWGLLASPRPGADVVLSWDERPGAVLALRHGRRIPVVTNVIWLTDEVRRRSPWTPLALAGLRRAAGVFVLSSAQVPVLRRLGIAAERIGVVPFGVDDDFFTPRSDVGDPDLVVSVGNDRHRDWAATLAVFHRVRRERPNARLVVVSRTAPAEAVAAVEGTELVRHVDHVGLRDLLARAGVLLVMTRQNLHLSGITATLEALAMGRPAVISRSPGLEDYADLTTGIVPAAGVPQAASAVTALLGDEQARRERGTAGRAAVVEHFSSRRQAEHIAALLQRAVQG